MSASLDIAVDEMDLPRRNGELAFEAPWEGRAFGVAVALCEGDHYPWETFRQALIAEIATWERAHEAGPPDAWRYYERWLAALEEVLVAGGLHTPDEIDVATARVAHGIAHEHDH